MRPLPGRISIRLMAQHGPESPGWWPDHETHAPVRRRAAVGYRVGARRRPSWWTRKLAITRDVCRADPIGRIAARVVWLGLLIATSGTWQLAGELRRNGPHHGPARGWAL